nr:immunoglobulin light chain junction region [Macaca mulatta]
DYSCQVCDTSDHYIF